MEVLRVAVGREIKPSEVVLRARLLTSMLKMKHRFHLSIIRQLLLVVAQVLRVGGEIPGGQLAIMQEAPSEAAVVDFLSEGPANEVQVKEEDGETGKR